MADDERQPLLHVNGDRRLNKLQQDEEASSIIRSHVTAEEQKMGGSSVGERLPYNDYTTIDWLHDLVSAGLYPISHRLMEAKTLAGQRLLPPPLYPHP